ncbi:pyridoxal-phosphate dependent enzyme [Streptomyces milbemycinicus]|uniref:pyridoxal-phosphate dependent enzyme n=1 Tax=Streptomyces milbemycinicus TaxID=476552 RepID=UPI0033E5400F
MARIEKAMGASAREAAAAHAVNAAGVPSMRGSLRAGRPVTAERGATFADGIAVRTPLEASVRRARELVDEIVLVTDEAIAAAMELAARTLGVVLEPAGAAGLAAIAGAQSPATARNFRGGAGPQAPWSARRGLA